MKIEEEIDDNKKELFYLKHKDCCKKLLNKDFFSTTGGRVQLYNNSYWTRIYNRNEM